MIPDAFRGRKKQDSPGLQCIVEHWNQPILKRGFQVDQQVPATQQIEFDQRRILDHVLERKNDHVPDLFRHTKARLFPHKIAFEAVWPDVRRNARGVPTRARRCNRILVQIRGVELNAEVQPMIQHEFAQQNHQGVGLLAACAPDDPGAEDESGGFILDQKGKHFVLHDGEGQRVTKEAGDINQQFFQQRLDLFRALL